MEGLYLMHTREFIATNKPIMKLGRSNNTENRTNQYPKGSRIMLMIACKNSIACEAYLINLFKTKFKQAKYYGTEYFEGNYRDMIKEICNYVNNLAVVEDVIEENKVVVKEDKKEEKVDEKVVVKEDKKEDKKKEEKKEEKKKEEKKKKKEEKEKKILKKDRTCPKCNYVFKFPSMLKIHFRKSYHCLLNEEEIMLFVNPNINIIKCNICCRDFKQKSSLYRHQRNIKCSKSQETISN